MRGVILSFAIVLGSLFAAPAEARDFAPTGGTARFVDCMLSSLESGCRVAAEGRLPDAETLPSLSRAFVLPNDQTGPGALFFSTVMIMGLIGLGAMGAGAILTFRD